MKKFIFFIFFIILGANVIAQTGIAKGIISDSDNNETIPFANVIILETGKGFTTDLDGMFLEELPIGKYTFEVSYLGYSLKRIENINIVEGQTFEINIQMETESQQLDDIVVMGKQLRNTENAVMAIQRKSTNLIDGVSSQTLRKIGDSNAGAAVKRITGVSVESGKYVYVRGLGDRYTKTLLNGMELPGLDPDKNAMQLDIIPSSIIDNILVSKSFNPNLPGDFSGGVIDILTKDYPEEKTASVSLGFSYNPQMHFKNNFISSAKSNTDWLGFDNGTRSLPINKYQTISAPINDPNLTIITQKFSNNMGTTQSRSLPNMNVGFTFGNQLNKRFGKIGYHATLNYANSTDFFQKVSLNNYVKSSDPSEMKLLVDRTSLGNLSVNNVLLSALIGGGMQIGNNAFGIKILHIQNGSDKAGLFERNSFIRSSNTILTDNVEYTQRAISNILLSGRHQLANDFKIDWKLSPTLSKINDKDVKVSPFRLGDDGGLTIEPSEGAQPRRLYRNLEEINLNGRIDISKSIFIGDKEINLEFGINNIHKTRDYEILSYLVNVKGQSNLNINGDANKLFLSENIWTPETQIGTYIIGNYEPTNTYSAIQNTLSSFVMSDLKISDKLNIITGIRFEKFTHYYTGQNNAGNIIYDNKKIADNINFLPSLNLSYQLNKHMKLRLAASKTIARPSFKESSIAQIYDAISDATFIGNIDLVQTDINNYDLRWEMYMKTGERISVSAFYKQFFNPIEIVAYSSSAPGDLQPRNVGNAMVKGVEFDMSKNLDFISPTLENLKIGSNVTIVQSEVALDKSLGGEFESREKVVREGEEISEVRPMQGQAPYIVNTFLTYLNDDNGWEGTLSYNVQGKSLAIVGIGLNPDVYTSPFHNLSLKISKSLGENNRMRFSVSADNMLYSQKNKVYLSYGAEDQIAESYIPYSSYGLSFSYQLY